MAEYIILNIAVLVFYFNHMHIIEKAIKKEDNFTVFNKYINGFLIIVIIYCLLGIIGS